MKKLLIFLLVCILLVGCSKTNKEPSNGNTINRFDCFEFDINNLQFTDNILLTVNLTSDYQEVEQKDLLYKDPDYYIGEYKRYDETGNSNRTISIYETTDSSIDLATNYKNVGNNWYINTNEFVDNTYIQNFYSEINGYTIVLKIANTDKSNISTEDAIKILSFMINKECSIPSDKDSSSVTVPGTLEEPARIGKNEWVSTYAYNAVSNKYEPISVCINAIYTGEYVDQLITNYNNIHYGVTENFEYIEAKPNLEYVAINYSIYFPNSFTEGSNGVPDVSIPFSICNLKDNGQGISGVTNLNDYVLDISNSKVNISKGTIWSEGTLIYQVPKNFTNYLIKISPNMSNPEIKYFKIS